MCKIMHTKRTPGMMVSFQWATTTVAAYYDGLCVSIQDVFHHSTEQDSAQTADSGLRVRLQDHTSLPHRHGVHTSRLTWNVQRTENVLSRLVVAHANAGARHGRPKTTDLTKIKMTALPWVPAVGRGQGQSAPPPWILTYEISLMRELYLV